MNNFGPTYHNKGRGLLLSLDIHTIRMHKKEGRRVAPGAAAPASNSTPQWNVQTLVRKILRHSLYTSQFTYMCASTPRRFVLHVAHHGELEMHVTPCHAQTALNILQTVRILNMRIKRKSKQFEVIGNKNACPVNMHSARAY